MSTSKCIYCDSTSYGRPCLFSPTNTHAHMSDPGRCMYCGGKYKGHGCVYNPYGKIHVSAPDFLNRSNLKSENAVLLHYFLRKTTSSEVLGEGYKSPLDRFYKRLKGIVLNLSLPLLEALFLTETHLYKSLSKQQIIDSVELKGQFKNVLYDLASLIKEAEKKLPLEMVEETLLNAILDKNED